MMIPRARLLRLAIFLGGVLTAVLAALVLIASLWLALWPNAC